MFWWWGICRTVQDSTTGIFSASPWEGHLHTIWGLKRCIQEVVLSMWDSMLLYWWGRRKFPAFWGPQSAECSAFQAHASFFYYLASLLSKIDVPFLALLLLSYLSLPFMPVFFCFTPPFYVFYHGCLCCCTFLWFLMDCSRIYPHSQAPFFSCIFARVPTTFLLFTSVPSRSQPCSLLAQASQSCPFLLNSSLQMT